MCDNIGISGQSPSVYLPTGDTDLADIFLTTGGQCVYPVPDAGHQYVGAQDRKFFFSYQGEGSDVDADAAIDGVGVTFYGKLAFAKTLHIYFKTGGVKYYLPVQQGGSFFADNIQYGVSGSIYNNPLMWYLNPATGLPWTLAQVTAGEFGFESNADFDLRAAFVQIYWGFGLTAPASGPGGTPADAPCGQSVTLSSAFTNFESKILEVTPGYGPLAGGTQIIIRGYNFAAGSTVTVGGLPATGVQFVDDQHYVATVPAHAVGFADVVINEPSGVSVVYHNGFQYTLFTRGEDIRRSPGVTIQLGLNSGSNSCSFQVDGESNPPKVGEKIQIIDEFESPRRLLFAGNVQSVDQIYEGQNTQLAWNVSAVDFTWLLNRRRPFGEYHNVSASDIVKDLILKYAPGFTTNFVQTSLAKISIAFDGSWDLQTCLSVLARMIGGGHWYVDFTQDVHFFHIVPPSVTMPTAPLSSAPPVPQATSESASTTTVTGSGAMLHVGPASAPTVVRGDVNPYLFSYTPGFYFFQVTFIYDNGVESAYGQAMVAPLDGRHQTVFSNVPIGPNLGSLICIKRRIYFTISTAVGSGKRRPYLQIDDNTTTGFTLPRQAPNDSTEVPGLSSVIGQVCPPEPAVAPPPYTETTIPTVSGTSTLAPTMQTEIGGLFGFPVAWSAGVYRFRVVNIYQDLTESLPGPATAPFSSDGSHLVRMVNVPVGTTLNGVPVIARRILGAFGASPQDADYRSWWVIPDNIATYAEIAPLTPIAQGLIVTGPTEEPAAPAVDTNPVWPNADGPFLEGFDRPTDVTDDNPLLLRDPQITSSVDLSQIRNRILIRGAGSTATSSVAAGATSIPVADCSFYSSNGGQVFVEGQILTYTGLSAASGPGTLTLSGTAGEPINSGAPVSLYVVVEDQTSQDDIGRIELDFNGQATDGVHEYVIVDASLTTPLQMFMRGQAELELYARPITTVRYSTRDPKTRPGALVTIRTVNPPISGEFLIQDVMIDQIHDDADELLEPRYNVTTSSNKFDLNDLFFQWATKTSNPNSGAGGSTGPDPSQSGLADAVLASTTSGSGSRYFIGVDPGATSEFKWVTSKDTFATFATSTKPATSVANQALALAIGGTVRRHMGVSVAHLGETWFLYPSDYTRALNEYPRMRRCSLDANGVMTDAALFTVPENTILTSHGFTNVQWAATPARIPDLKVGGTVTVGHKIYFIAQDFVDNAVLGYFSRVMEYDLDTGVIRQIGQGCNNSGSHVGEIGGGAVAFTCLGYAAGGILLAGVGSMQTGFNSTDAGIWSINPSTGLVWTREIDLSGGTVGETPMCFGNLNGVSYCGLTRLDAGTARMLVRSGSGAWSTSTSFGSGINNAWTTMRTFIKTGQDPILFATAYENLGGVDTSKIYSFDGTTWTVVKTIETINNPVVGVAAIQKDGDKMLFLCANASGRATIAITDDGFSWTLLTGITSATSVFGTSGGAVDSNGQEIFVF